MPNWVAAALDSRLFSRLARVILTFVFWSSGLAKVIDWNATLAEMTHFKLDPPAAFGVATILVQLGGSALVIWGRYAWLGAGALAVFTALTIPIAHPFWSMQEPQRTLEMYTVVEHIAVIGGLMLAAIIARREQRRS